jgi:hypothetical protein
MAPYQPPHDGATGVDVSILSIEWPPHSGQFNSFSSPGPLGTGISKLDLHRRQVSSHVSVISRFFFGDISLHLEPKWGSYTDITLVWYESNITNKGLSLQEKEPRKMGR